MSKKQNTWMDALTAWNRSNNRSTWCIPKRGSADYKAVINIQTKIKAKRHRKKFREAAFGPAQSTAHKKKKKRRIVDDSDADDDAKVSNTLGLGSEYAQTTDFVLDALIDKKFEKLNVSSKLKSLESKIVKYQQLEKKENLDSVSRLAAAMKFDRSLKVPRDRIQQYLNSKIDNQWQDLKEAKTMIESGEIERFTVRNKHELALRLMFRAEQIRFLFRVIYQGNTEKRYRTVQTIVDQ